jgi:Xaa-Pro aminopeptidase
MEMITMTKNLYKDRIKALQANMDATGIDLVAIAPTANMRYLAGFAPLMDERFCALLVGREEIRAVIPELNADQVETHTELSAMRWTDAEGPRHTLQKALQELGIEPGAILSADNTMRADSLLLLQEMINPMRSVAAGQIMTPLRVHKSEDEIEILQRSAVLADKALLAGVEVCRPGATERDVAEVISAYFRSGGAEAIDFIIVASGPNGAFPHHETGERVLQEGDTIIIDIGASLNSYKSDITRVVYLGRPSDEMIAMYDAVLEANIKARQVAEAGKRASEVDLAARETLEKAGFGPYFVHRTGHGLGLETHEPPWITSTSQTVLEPGMVFSIEPGVYIQGKLGIRIEDIVVVTDGECLNLTGLDHELIVKA